jgi:uncharacterized RmlC-like cupin family protein
VAANQSPWGEYAKWLHGNESLSYYQDMLDEAAMAPAKNAERKKIIKAHELPFENSPHGLLKHLVNESMNARCETVDAYMQIIPPGSRSGKHRQLAEQAFYVIEGRGYDEHVDCDLSIVDDHYTWKPEDRVQRFEWEAGDVVYIPPNTISQHFNADPGRTARIIVITNRIYRQSGLNDLIQIENAPEYCAGEQLTAERLRTYLNATPVEA